MSLFAGWVLVPVVLALLCAGLGLLVERATRVTLAGALVPVVGFAALIAVSGIPTIWDATAPVTVQLVVVLAVAGLVWGRAWADPRLAAARWPLAVVAGAYALFAFPSLGSGQGSVTGYVKLDDASTWMALVDQVMEHGRNLSVNAPSSYASTLDSWLAGGYPVGAFMPTGVVAKLTGQDLINVYQPVIAFAAALLALGLYACARTLLSNRLLAAAAALVAVQASLFVGYTQWGGIKEPVTAALLPPLALFAVRRQLPALAIVSGALFGVLGVNAVAWVGPALVLALVGVARNWSPRTVREVGLGLVTLGVAALPALTSLDFAENTTNGAISAQNDLGNLYHPLPLIQGFGLWPVGDFRIDPDPRWMAVLLALGGLGAAVAAVVRAARDGSWELPAMVLITLVGSIAALVIGSPWVDAKALTVLAPILLAGTAIFVLSGFERPGPLIPAVSSGFAVLLLAGCAWSTLAVARDVYVVPRERLAELRDFAPLIDGRGPTVVLDFDAYANRHLLRDTLAEGATDLRPRLVARLDGTPFPRLTSAEVDQVRTQDLWVYSAIVRRRTPVGSRPPTAFRLLRAGRYWEVWTRDPAAPAPLQRLPLGDALNPVAVPKCSSVAELSKVPGVRVLAAVPGQPPLVTDLTSGDIPAAWVHSDGVRPVVDGTGSVTVELPRDGEWRAWVGGSVLGHLQVSVDGHDVGQRRHDLAYPGQWMRFGARRLSAGSHVISLRYERGWRPGRGPANEQAPLGPVALSFEQTPSVVEIAPREYRRLCSGAPYDWIEALG